MEVAAGAVGSKVGVPTGNAERVPPPTSEHRRKTLLCQRVIPEAEGVAALCSAHEDGHVGPPRVERATNGVPRAGSSQSSTCPLAVAHPFDSRVGSSVSYGALGALQDASGHWLYGCWVRPRQ